jgi:hypothetical protein
MENSGSLLVLSLQSNTVIKNALIQYTLHRFIVFYLDTEILYLFYWKLMYLFWNNKPIQQNWTQSDGWKPNQIINQQTNPLNYAIYLLCGSQVSTFKRQTTGYSTELIWSILQ